MKDSGYLLSYVRYGDHDAILHCFTKNNGYQSFFVKGIYSPKSKKKAYLAPLNELTFIVNDTQRKGIANINKIEQVKSVENADVRISAIVFFIAEFLHQSLKTETKQEQIYDEIACFLEHLNEQYFQCHYGLLLNFLKIQGLAPLLGEGHFLDPETGCFGHQQGHQYFNQEISECWKILLIEENPYCLRLKNELKSDFLDSILVYYMHHFPDFRFPKSLEVLKEVFN